MADNEAIEYEIRVRGRLAPRWAQWFDGMTLAPADDGTTVISGAVADQSELHGLLRKLGDLGLPLVSVTQLRPAGAQAAARTTSTRPMRRSTS